MLSLSALSQVSFQANQTDGCAPVGVIISVTSPDPGTISSYWWTITFPDNSTFTSSSPEYVDILSDPGSYSISLTINGNETATEVDYITVHEIPHPNFIVDDNEGCWPLCVQFTDITDQSDGQIVEWSIRDESLHSKMGCRLFRHMCEEDKELLNECRKDIIAAAVAMLKAEENYIDRMFEAGDIDGIKSYDLKQFIRKRLNEKLQELGYFDLGIYFEFNEKAASNLDWFYHLTGGHTHTDFFAVRPTDYSKANEGEDFEDIW